MSRRNRSMIEIRGCSREGRNVIRPDASGAGINLYRSSRFPTGNYGQAFIENKTDDIRVVRNVRRLEVTDRS